MKKKKLTFNSLAFGNLKHRKKQYTLLIIGIILSMVFSSSVLFLVTSAFSTIEEARYKKFGKEDCIFYNLQNYKNVDECLEEYYDSFGFAHVLGYLSPIGGEKETGTVVAWLDDTAVDIYNLNIKEGRLPKKSNEIALEKDALDRMGLNAKVGEKISLYLYPQNSEKLLKKRVEKTYTLVGILEDKRYNFEVDLESVESNKLPAAFVCSGTQTEIGGKEALAAFVVHNDNADQILIDSSFKHSVGMYENNDVEYVRRHSDFELQNKYLFSTGEPFFICFFMAVVLMLVSSIGIVNAFNTNLKSRKKQIGLLRAVGATKRQIIKVYGREALVLSLLCAPVSILISICLTSFIVSFFGEGYVFKPVWWILPICVVVSVICVCLATIMPLFSASRITPIQVIRNIDINRKMRNKKIKTQTSFVPSKLLANRNITLFKSKGVLTSVILCIAIAVSCFGFCITAAIKETYEVMPYSYFIGTQGDSLGFFINSKETKKGFSETDKQNIMSNYDVLNVYGNKITTGFMLVDEFTDYMRLCCYDSDYYGLFDDDSISEENYKSFEKNTEKGEEVKKNIGYTQEMFPVDIIAFDDKEMNEINDFVVVGNINKEKIDSGEEVILHVSPGLKLVMTNVSYKGDYAPSSHLYATDLDTEVIEHSENDYIEKKTILESAKNDFKVGQEINVGWIYNYSDSSKPQYKHKEHTAKIGAIIYEFPDENSGYATSGALDGKVDIITSFEGMANFADNVSYEILKVDLKSDCNDDIEARMQNTLKKVTSGKGAYIYSAYEDLKKQKEEYQTLLVITLSVTILFFSMCGSMLNNSITARIRESKREIGTLRAVGATANDIALSYIRQMTFVFGVGIISGFLLFFVGYGLCALVYKAMNEPFNEMSFSFLETIIACALLVIICFVNIYIKVRKEMKNSIVENIREL